MKHAADILFISTFIVVSLLSLQDYSVTSTEIFDSTTNEKVTFRKTRDNRKSDNAIIGRRKNKRGKASRRDSCPRLEKCFCRAKRTAGLDVTCNGVTSQQLEADTDILKREERNIAYFKIRNCNIPKLKDFLFMGIKITYLYITDCKLSSLEPESLSSQEDTLTHVVLSSNQLTTVPTEAIKKLSMLQNLDLNANNISSLHANAFDGLRKLTKISLYNNEIRYVDPKAFGGQANLEHGAGVRMNLNLGQNKLTEVPISALKDLHHLEILDLKQNKIKDVGEEDFTGLNNLDHLILQHNEIAQLKDQVFKGLTKLNSLYIDNNRISVIEDLAFVGLENALEILQMSGNFLKAFPTKPLKILKKLKTIWLNNNKIDHVDENAFEGFGKTLSYLWLQDNQIKDIPPTTFQSLYSIERLRLSGNQLTTIHYELMEPILSTVLHLEIHDNPLVCDCELNWYRQWINSMDQMKDYQRDDLPDVKCLDPNTNKKYKLMNVPDELMPCDGNSELIQPPKLSNCGNQTDDKTTKDSLSKLGLDESSSWINPWSFTGGIILIVGSFGLVFAAIKLYKAKFSRRRNFNYTLSEDNANIVADDTRVTC